MATNDPEEPNALQPDDNIDNDVDSALGDDQSALTQSLRSSLMDSVKENGRNYHRYETRAGGPGYILPEDEMEQDRQNLQHEMYLYGMI
jgi:hypothetical protein